MKKDRIVVVGSSNTDMIIKLDRIPKEGETLLGGEFSMAAGGKGANQAVGAARAGGQVTFVARVGQDMFGEQAVAGFKKDGIDVSYVFHDGKKPSGVALIFVANDGENSIAVASGANAALAPADIRKANEALTTASTVVFQLETPLETVEAAAKLAKKAGARVILNPAPARRLPATLLRCVSILTPNETEAELLTGVKVQDAESAGKAAQKLQDLGVETVVMTLGSKGAFYQDKDQQGLIPAFKVKAVDTTAAGDVFNGALAVALTEGKELKQALRFASAAAAISVTRLGAQPSAPTRKEIEKFLKSN
jgi:ribokinase